MERLTAVALLAVAFGCGTVQDRTLCTAGSCPTGQYCGPAGACLADVTAPVVGTVEASPGQVRRDGSVTVRVPVSDDQGVTGVTAALDLPGAPAVALATGSEGWEGQLAIAALPFPDYARTVAVRVVARDAAGNEGRGAGAVTVTRALWSLQIGARLTAAAVASDGGAIVGVDRGERQLVKVTSAGAVAWEATLGTMGIVAPPGVGEGTGSTSRLFAGTSEGRAWLLSSLGEVQNGAGCVTHSPIETSPAVKANRTSAYFATRLGAIYLLDETGQCTSASGTKLIASHPAVDQSGIVYVASGGFLNAYEEVAGQFYLHWFNDPPPPGIGGETTVPIAIEANGGVWTLSTGGALNATKSTAETRLVTTLPPSPAGPIILADGSIVLGDGAGVVHRIDPATGLDRWASLSLGASPVTAMVLTGTEADLIVPTVDGVLHALRSSDGGEVWRIRLSSAGDLKPGNLHTPAGSAWSTGYFPSSDGTLYAVLLDGRLDAAAPWPKAFHDFRNTNNAASPLP